MWVALILSLLLWVKRVFPYWADSSGDLRLDFILLGWVHTAFSRLGLLRRSSTYKLHVRSASFKRELKLIQCLFFICCKFSIIIIWRLTLYLNSICNWISKAWLKSRANLRILNSKGKISLMTSLLGLMWYLNKSLFPQNLRLCCYHDLRSWPCQTVPDRVCFAKSFQLSRAPV